MMLSLRRGFTLIELLVVLVIMSMAVTTLITGLNTTWSNFDKLLLRNLANQTARLPAVWLENSIRSVVLYHPEKKYFEGDRHNIQFVSSSVPSAERAIPLEITWRIQQVGDVFQLSWVSQKGIKENIFEFAAEPQFEYLTSQVWESEFSQSGLVPEAVRLVYKNEVWAFAAPRRPVEADVPQELPMTGIYEF